MRQSSEPGTALANLIQRNPLLNKKYFQAQPFTHNANLSHYVAAFARPRAVHSPLEAGCSP
jgi:hypothetical protein